MARATGPRAKRIYDDASPDDGVRVLVDRVWPRGVSKQQAHLDEWLKAVAPSTALRSWYGHDAARLAEFTSRYEAELTESERAEAFAHLKALAKDARVTLLTATKELELSQAAVLVKLLR